MNQSPFVVPSVSPGGVSPAVVSAVSPQGNRTGMFTPSVPSAVANGNNIVGTRPRTLVPSTQFSDNNGRTTVMPSASGARTVTLPSVVPTAFGTRTAALPSVMPTVVNGRTALPTVMPSVVNGRTALPSVMPTVVNGGGMAAVPLATTQAAVPSAVVSSPIVHTPILRLDGEEKTVEELLADQEYVVMEKIFVSDMDGHAFPKYFKVCNSWGYTFYVELDGDGLVMYDAENKVMIQSNLASRVPHSIKMGNFSCSTGAGACGVLFECDGDVCSVTKSMDDVDEAREVVLTVSTTHEQKALTTSDSLMAYPVIRLTFLLKNCQEMEHIVAKAIKSIRASAYKRCMQDWADYSCSMKAFHKSSDSAYGLMKKAFDDLGMSMEKLLQYRVMYMRKKACGKWCDDDKCKYAKIVEEIRRRDELFIKLVAACGLIRAFNRKVKKMTCALDVTCEFIADNYKNLTN